MSKDKNRWIFAPIGRRPVAPLEPEEDLDTMPDVTSEQMDKARQMDLCSYFEHPASRRIRIAECRGINPWEAEDE